MLTQIAINALTSSPVCSLMRPIRRQVVPVFLLHRFSDPVRDVCGHSKSDLQRALHYLHVNGYKVISLREVVVALINGTALPEKSVAFTLDDGFYDQAEIALPIFERFGYPVTIFLATDMQQKRHWSWDYKLEYSFKHTNKRVIDFNFGDGLSRFHFATEMERRLLVRSFKNYYKQQPNTVAEQGVMDIACQLDVQLTTQAPQQYEPITWDRATALESDLVEFGPHSKQHNILAQLSDSEVKEEIVGSWETIQRHLSNPIPVFCFPSGRSGIDFGAREQELVSKAGLIAALSADPGYIYLNKDLPNNLFKLKRFSFPDRLSSFKQYCSWLEYAKERLRPSSIAKSTLTTVSVAGASWKGP